MNKLKTSTFIHSLTGLALITLEIGLILLIIRQVQNHAMREAEEKARIILYRNLVSRINFSHQLKSAVFDLVDLYLEEGYFDPRWMSPTYAVCEIDNNFQEMTDYQGYYYREAAINARSPENEADSFEREFLEAIDADPARSSTSSVRYIDGELYFVTLIRGEVMEETCLRSHSQPEVSPRGLVDTYGA